MTDLEIIKGIEEKYGVELTPFESGYIEGESIRFIPESPRLSFEAIDGFVIKLEIAGIKSLPSEIFRLSSLVELDIWRIPIGYIPPEIKRLKRLKSLTIGESNIGFIPDWISEMKNLKSLNFGNNGIENIPDSLHQLPKLQFLFLWGNPINDFPLSLLNSPALTHIYLNQTNITNLSKVVFMKFQGEIGSFEPFETYHIPSLINIGNCPIQSPPLEIISQGKQAVLNYFDSLETQTSRPLNEVKVILVGDGGAGKTSVISQITEGAFDPFQSQTHGIQIKPWQINRGDTPTQLNFWDFGGQEIMHATHQFFLSKRSVYILLLDARQESAPEYWLQQVKVFGGNSPVIVVINKIDENPAYDVNRNYLLRKYTNIVGFLRTSMKEGTGVMELVDVLYDSLLKLDHLNTIWPGTWFEVKSELESLETPYIGIEDYLKICEKAGVEEESSRQTLLEFLHDLGIILYFRDLDELDTQVLDPHWVTNAVYAIINSKLVAENKGMLEMGFIPQILPDTTVYPSDRYPFILSMMKKFELCYELAEGKLLIPDLLPIQEPELPFWVEDEDAILYYFDYEYMPRSVLPRLMVRMKAAIQGELRWRTGVVMGEAAGNSKAVITADYDLRRIAILSIGSGKKELLANIIEVIRGIHTSFKELNVTEKIPVAPERNINVSFDHLKLLHSLGTKEFIPDGAQRKYNVSDLLARILPAPSSPAA